MNPQPITEDSAERVRAALGLAATRPEGAPDESPVPAEAPATSPPLKARVKAIVKRAAARPARAVWGRLSPSVAAKVTEQIRPQLEQAQTDVEIVAGELRSLAGLARVTSAAADLDGLVQEAAPVSAQLHQLTVNLELMKGELRSFGDLLEDVGRAIAPGAGLVGVADRFAELRERVNAMDRRLRQLTASTAAGGAAAPTPAQAAGPAPAAAGGSGFDYVGFEQRFRGDAAVVLSTLRDRYFDLLVPAGSVLDVGCGRGELLTSLAAEGVTVTGVDLDTAMVAEARAAGVDAHVGDAVEFLRTQAEGSFGAITAMQVVEHLPLPTLVELLELAATRLRPGGVFIAETPNPTSLIVLGNSYILDPTHVWPLHPSLLTFLCERAGFRDVELRFFEPATGYHVPLADGAAAAEAPELAAAMNRALAQLNDTLFGPQDYAAVARRS